MLEALEATALATWLRHSTVAYPLLSAVHVAAVGGLVTLVLLMDLRLAGGLARLPVAAVAEALQPAAATALATAAVTGGLLFTVSAVDYVANPAFRLKLVCLVVALANVVLVHATGIWRRFCAGGVAAAPTRALAGASAVAWALVLIAGRFIGFV